MVGFSFVFALTSATSSGDWRPRSLITIGAKWIERMIAWIATEMPRAQPSSLSLRALASASGGIRAGGNAPAGASFAVRTGRAMPGFALGRVSGDGSVGSFATAAVLRTRFTGTTVGAAPAGGAGGVGWAGRRGTRR